ncbi:MAG: hypothetical protein LBM70_03195 [Victivallales bacterium]|nr:hypothetical protein [Victivallales bacterium]
MAIFFAGGRFLFGFLLTLGCFIFYGVKNFNRFFGKQDDPDGIFIRDYGHPPPHFDARGRAAHGYLCMQLLLFAPHMFFLGIKLFIQGFALLFTRKEEITTLLQTLDRCDKTTIENLAVCSGIPKERTIKLLKLLDAATHTRNSEVILLPEWEREL